MLHDMKVYASHPSRGSGGNTTACPNCRHSLVAGALRGEPVRSCETCGLVWKVVARHLEEVPGALDRMVEK